MKCKLSVYSLDQGTKPTAELITAKPFVMLRATDMLETTIYDDGCRHSSYRFINGDPRNKKNIKILSGKTL